MKKVKVIYMRPSEFPVSMEIENELEEYQKLVEGYIETVPISDRTLIVCNEEGKLKGMQPNIIYGNDLIVGPIFFVDVDEYGDFTDCSMSVEDLIRCLI